MPPACLGFCFFEARLSDSPRLTTKPLRFARNEAICSCEHTPGKIMPKPLNVDWPAVRVLAVAVGVREAARQNGD